MRLAGLAERLKVVREIRERAVDCFTSALADSSSQSERAICDRWVRTTGGGNGLWPEGWYQPPPQGACILIGHPADGFRRLNYRSLRDPATWPKDDIVLSDEALIYGYSSPASQTGGLIGDVGITIYLGDDQRIQEHTLACLTLTTEIAKVAEVGMKLSELFDYGQGLINRAGLANQATSTIGEVPNIGHTIPFTDRDYTDSELGTLAAGDPSAVRELISRSRVRINRGTALEIQPTMAFTVEPQISSVSAPICSYHVIVSFCGGQKQVIHSFERPFETFGMTAHARLARAMDS